MYNYKEFIKESQDFFSLRDISRLKSDIEDNSFNNWHLNIKSESNNKLTITIKNLDAFKEYNNNINSDFSLISNNDERMVDIFIGYSITISESNIRVLLVTIQYDQKTKSMETSDESYSYHDIKNLKNLMSNITNHLIKVVSKDPQL